MTFRERLMAVFAGQRPDVLPWFADLSYWRTAHQSNGSLPPEYATDEGYVALHHDHHVGFYLAYAGVYGMSAEGASIEVEQHREGDRIFSRTVTPAGTIEGEQVYLPHTNSTAWIRYPVSNPDDLAVVRYLYEARQVFPIYESWLHWDELTGDLGVQVACIPRGGVFSLTAEWCGVMNLSYLLADAPEDVQRTVDVMLEYNLSVIDVMAASPAPLVEFCDNLTGEVATPLFARYHTDYYLEGNRRLHAAGKHTLTHVDGTLQGIIPLVAAAGVDAAEAVTPMPCGDVAVADLRELAGPDLIIFGGMPGAMFAPPFKAEDLRRQLEEILEHHWEAGKFVLGSADQIPPDGDMNLVRLVGEWCEELCTGR